MIDTLHTTVYGVEMGWWLILQRGTLYLLMYGSIVEENYEHDPDLDYIILAGCMLLSVVPFIGLVVYAWGMAGPFLNFLMKPR